MSIKLDAALLKKISTMTLRARYVAEGYISGLHQSPFRGHSLEFSQHRQYTPGDGLKYLDWKVYGRSDRFYIKQFQEETNLRGYSIIDVSESMGYSTSQVTKLEYASFLAAGITYLMIKQRDSAGLITFSENIEEFMPPRDFQAHMHHVMEKLDRLKSKGKTDFRNSFTEIGKRIKKRSMLIIFSDFLHDPEDLIKSLKFFPYRKNDVIAFNILDPGELSLQHQGSVEYVDSETGEKFRTIPSVIGRQYSERMREHLKKLEDGLRRHGIDFYPVTTDTPLDRAFAAFMEGRKNLAV